MSQKNNLTNVVLSNFVLKIYCKNDDIKFLYTNFIESIKLSNNLNLDNILNVEEFELLSPYDVIIPKQTSDFKIYLGIYLKMFKKNNMISYSYYLKPNFTKLKSKSEQIFSPIIYNKSTIIKSDNQNQIFIMFNNTSNNEYIIKKGQKIAVILNLAFESFDVMIKDNSKNNFNSIIN